MHLVHGSGTLFANDENLEKRFTQKLIEKSINSQKALLKKALQVLKPGQEIVYSTCSILSCENEEVVEEVLKTGKAKIVPIALEGKETLPLLPSRIEGALCVAPTKQYEGFFIVKIRKEI